MSPQCKQYTYYLAVQRTKVINITMSNFLPSTNISVYRYDSRYSAYHGHNYVVQGYLRTYTNRKGRHTDCTFIVSCMSPGSHVVIDPRITKISLLTCIGVFLQQLRITCSIIAKKTTYIRNTHINLLSHLNRRAKGEKWLTMLLL